MNHARRIAIVSLFALTALTCAAQTVYKCESKGAVTYSHEPCMGAQVVDTTPTQGLDRSSGTSRKGADVRTTEQNKAFADAMRPILGETQEQWDKRRRRFKLSPAERSECQNLDGRLVKLEAGTRAADKPTAAQAEVSLFESRKRYRELRC